MMLIHAPPYVLEDEQQDGDSDDDDDIVMPYCFRISNTSGTTTTAP
jgi:hypothetical protein